MYAKLCGPNQSISPVDQYLHEHEFLSQSLKFYRVHMVSITTRSRLPSFDVQRETRAALQAASECNRLPASFSGLGNFIVSEKNTFINIEPIEYSMESDCDLDLSVCEAGELSPVLPARVSARKNTDIVGASANGILLMNNERRMSSIPASSRIRRKSCPPDIALIDDDQPISYPETPTSDKRDHLKTPVALMQPATPPRKDREIIHRSSNPPMRRFGGVGQHPVPPARGRYYSMDVLSTPPPQNTPNSSLSIASTCLKPVDETVTTISPSSSPSTPQPARKHLSDDSGDDSRTTIMLRNVPYGECQVGVLELIKEKGFTGKFNFFYAPLDFNSGNNLGYAFINFFNHNDVSAFFDVFDGLRVERDGGWGQKELQVCWARVQGLDPNVEHYRNSPVNDMPEQFRPMVFNDDGSQMTFPRPDENMPRRPLPSSSYYGSKSSSTGSRPRFASAQFSNSGVMTGSSGRNRHPRTPSGSFNMINSAGSTNGGSRK